MGIWDDISSLLEGIEKDTVGKAGGASGGAQKCQKHGLKNCKVCSGSQSKGTAAPTQELQIEISDDISDALESSKNDRNRSSMDFQMWNREIEKLLSHVRKNKEKGQANFDKFKEAENELAFYSGNEKDGDADVMSFREEMYKRGMTYDDYVGAVNKKFSKKLSIWHGLRGRIYDDLAGKRFQKRKDKDIFGASAGEYSRADLEKDTVEFQEFEKWARELCDAYMKDRNGNPIPYDEKSFQETLHYFAASGQRFSTPIGEPGDGPPEGPGIQVSRKDTRGMEPLWTGELLRQRMESGKLGTMDEITIHQDPEQKISEPRGPSYRTEEPLYKKLMKMDRGAAGQVFISQLKKTMKQNQSLQAAAQKQIDQPAPIPQPPADWPQQMKDTWMQGQAEKGMMVPAGKPTPKQIDPQLFKKRTYQQPDREKRKFATWWDPFGFKGDIPFSKM